MRNLLALILIGLSVVAFADDSSTTTTAPAATATNSGSTTATKAMSNVTVNIPCLSDSPCAIVKDTSTKVMDAVNRSASPDETMTSIQDIAAPQFDFKLMTRYALGNNWKLATDKQQTQLVSLFRELLIYTYSAALSKFKAAKITLTDSTINTINTTGGTKNTAVVISQVLLPGNGNSNNQPVKVEYDLVRRDNQPWKAYDIKIENASLVTTYRNQFNDVVQSSKIDGLIKQLQTKVASLRAKGA